MSDAFDRQRAAEMLASNPLFGMLVEELKADAVATWKGSTTAPQREEQWMRYRCLEEIERRLEMVLNDAKLAADRRRRVERREEAVR